MDFSDVTNEIISQIVENAYNAVDVCGNSTSQIILDVCENEADAIISQIMETATIDSDDSKFAINELMSEDCKSNEILIHTVDNEYIDADSSEGKADEIITQTIETASGYVCEDTESKIILDACATDVEKIILQTIETASVNTCEDTESKIILDACVTDVEEIISQTIETASTDACEDPGKQIITDAIVAEPEEIISPNIETASIDACMAESANRIILDMCVTQVEEIISPKIETEAIDSNTSKLAINEIMLDGCKSSEILETIENEYNDVYATEEKADEVTPQAIEAASVDACENLGSKIIADAIVAEPEEIISPNVETATIDSEASKLAINELMMDCCKSSEILIQTVDNEYNDVDHSEGKADEVTPQAIKTASGDACEDRGIKSIIDACLLEAEEIINQIVESAYDVAHPSDTCDVDATSLDEEIEPQSLADVDAKSDASFIVESIDCIDPNTKNGVDEDMEIVATAEAESDDSIVVECIETCKNEEMITPAVIISESSAIVNQPTRVDANSGISFDGKTDVERSRIESVKSTDEVCELPSTEEFYNDELLRLKGYNMQMFTNTKRFVNLLLSADPKNKSEVQCTGLPCGVTANEVMPMLDKCGQVFELRISANTGAVVVTYMTEKEGDNAIQLLNGREFQGKVINVEKFAKRTRLIVRPISIDAQKPELFNEFSKLTKGLDSVFLTYAPGERQHRGYCYLNYIGHNEAAMAKKTLSSLNYNGERVFCDWAKSQPLNKCFWRKLFMNNLHSEMSISDLRRIFSVYGEVLEIDKSDNWASVKFQNPDDAMQAFQSVDRKLLGKKNVELSRTVLQDTFSQGSSERPSSPRTHRFGSHENPTQQFGSPANPTQRFGPCENSNAMHRKPIVENSTKLYGTRQRISTDNNTKADQNERHGVRKDMTTLSNNNRQSSGNNASTMKSAAQVFFLKK